MGREIKIRDIEKYHRESVELAVKATLKRKPRTETKAGIPPGAVSSRRHFI